MSVLRQAPAPPPFRPTHEIFLRKQWVPVEGTEFLSGRLEFRTENGGRGTKQPGQWRRLTKGKT